MQFSRRPERFFVLLTIALTVAGCKAKTATISGRSGGFTSAKAAEDSLLQPLGHTTRTHLGWIVTTTNPGGALRAEFRGDSRTLILQTHTKKLPDGTFQLDWSVTASGGDEGQNARDARQLADEITAAR